MARLSKLLCCLGVVFVVGCGNEEDSNAPVDSGANVETPIGETTELPAGGKNTADRDGEKPPADTTVYPVKQVLEALQAEASDDPIIDFVNTRGSIGIRGVISEIHPYKKHIFEDTPEPMIKLESGVPDLSQYFVADLLIECQFTEPQDLKGLKVGQLIELSGVISRSYNSQGPDSFKMEECQLLAAEPATIASYPFYSFEASITDYADDGEKLDQLLTRLNDAGISYFNPSINENMIYRVEVYDSLAGEDGHLPQEVIDSLNEIPLISRLELSPLDGISDTIAQDLKAVRYCQEIQVGAGFLTGAGLESLLAIPGVYDLQLSGVTLLEPEDFEALKQAPFLRKLDVWGDPFADEPAFKGGGDEVLLRLKYTPELRELTLSNLDITDDGLTAFENLPRIRYLSITNCKISGSGLKHLANAENFWCLRLQSETLNDDLSDALSALSRLVVLDVSGPAVTSKIGSAFSNLEQLQNLTLSGTGIDDSIAESLGQLNSLRELWLNRTQIGDDFNLPISALPHLRYVNLSGTQVGGNVCAKLGTGSSLTSVSLGQTPVDDDDIQRLVESATQSKLEKINLTQTNVTEKCLLSLAKLPSLKHVTLSDSVEVSDETKKVLTDGEIELTLERPLPPLQIN